VIALAGDRDIEIAKKTVGLLPSAIPSVVFHFPGNVVSGGISAVLTGFFLTAIAGEIRGIDPGRPGVPTFGRKLYHLGLGAHKKTSTGEKPSVRRKLDVCNVPSQKIIKAHSAFCRTLGEAQFSCLVMDYDGTLCDSHNRFNDLDASIVCELIRLLRAGVPLGIATGRGKSVRKSLQDALPKTLWEKVILGYYNGAECGLLNDDGVPDGTSSSCTELENIARTLSSDEAITSLATVTVRKSQISVEPSTTAHLDLLWRIVGAHWSRHPGSRMVKSSHSIDILAPGVTKRNVIKTLLASYDIGQSSAILSIGDQGRWPGNDSELLSERYSLSVDAVSPDLETCWNLAPSGFRGQQATLYYLKNIVTAEGTFKFILGGAGGGGR
jgi:hydroxymethylpyrimidine pyrophosphatase-like HAD family hydrolase